MKSEDKKRAWVVQCKITDAVHTRLLTIKEAYNFNSVYEVVQALITLMLKNIDISVTEDDGRADEVRRMMEYFAERGDRVNVSGYGQEEELKMEGGVLFLTNKCGKGCICKTVTMDGDRLRTNYSSSAAVDAVMKYAAHDLHGALMQAGNGMREHRMDRVIENILYEWQDMSASRDYEEGAGEQYEWTEGMR